MFVGGKACKANYRMRRGDIVEFDLEPAREIDLLPQDIPLDIVYQDGDLAVINKPQGMVVHPAPGNEDGTLVNALLFHLRDLAGIGGELRPGIVHRIDKDTSGLLVIAKNDSAHRALAEQIPDQDGGPDLSGHRSQLSQGGGGDGGRPHRTPSRGPQAHGRCAGGGGARGCHTLESAGAV